MAESLRDQARVQRKKRHETREARIENTEITQQERMLSDYQKRLSKVDDVIKRVRRAQQLTEEGNVPVDKVVKCVLS